MKTALRRLFSVLCLTALCACVFAQTAEAVADAPATVGPAASATDTSMTTIVSLVLALVGGLVAIWKNSQASTAKKITQSLVLGVEQATQLPEVQHLEQKIKFTIREKAKDLGVQPLLHEVVKDLT